MPRNARAVRVSTAWRRTPTRTGTALVRCDVDVIRERAIAFDDRWITEVATTAAQEGGRRGRWSVALLLADDDVLQHLNRSFRGHDAPTDVLSFDADPKAPRTGGPNYLGDIAISVPRVVAQAEAHGHGLAREFAYLVVHGVLHLFGHDHDVDADQARMRVVEEAALARLGLTRTGAVVGDQE